MRALFTTTPGLGHLFPMVPLAWAFRCAGHQVLVAAPTQIAHAVRSMRLRAEIEAMPLPGEVVTQLEALVTSRPARTAT